MRKNLGFSPVIILIILALLVATGVVAYLFVNSKSASLTTNYRPLPAASAVPSTNATPLPVSNSQDTNTIQMELNQTDSGSIDSDINSLNSDAQSL